MKITMNKDKPISSYAAIDSEIDADKQRDKRNEFHLMYGIIDKPPKHIWAMLSIQSVLTEFGGLLSYPYMIGASICIDSDRVGFSELLNTVVFVSGMASLVQTTMGSRLPLVQGASFSFLIPVFVLMKTQEQLCPDFNNPSNMTLPFERGSQEHKALWRSNLNEISGSLMVAALFQIMLGLSGLIQILVRYIGPITISTVIFLTALSVYKTVSDKGSTHWGICFLVIFLVILFSQYINHLTVRLPGSPKLPIFTLFPILLSVVIAWIVCLVLTLTNLLPEESDQPGYRARTDINMDALQNTQWLSIPYPGRWGVPTVTVGGVLGMFTAMMIAATESVGNYYTCAAICNASPPPGSAVSRGIVAEGFGGLLGGALGSGGGCISYVSNLSTIRLTKVGSRAVIIGASCTMMLLGCFGKFGGVLATIPDPIVGGILFTVLGMSIAVAFSYLQAIDLSSTRNIFVVGLSIILGFSVSSWVLQNPINVGSDTVNQVLNTLCGTSMFLGGMVAFILDNSIRGTRKERGFLQMEDNDSYTDKDKEVYDLPIEFLNKHRCFRYIPIFPGWDRHDERKSYSEIES